MWRALDYEKKQNTSRVNHTSSGTKIYRELFKQFDGTKTVTGRSSRLYGFHGGIAQLVEHVLCKHEVTGSNPVASTNQRASPA